MTLLELVASRRSIRKFKDKRVDKETIEQILKATLTAPSSKNTRSTRIAITEDKEVLSHIASMRSSGSSFVADAPLAFIVMADESLCDLWRENCAISATILQLAAQSLGVGNCWVHVNGRPHSVDNPDAESATDWLHRHIPATKPYQILCVIAAGYPDDERRPHTLELDEDRIVAI